MRKIISIIFILLCFFTLSYTNTYAANGILGDADNSGTLTANDAATVLNMVLQGYTGQIETADMDGNGILTSADAAYILQKVLDNNYIISSESTTETTTDDTSSVLLVYYSHTGTTRNMANQIQSILGCDIAEVTPVVPYTDVYSQLLTVAQQEIASDARPEFVLNANIDDINKYDTVIVGYPIWWNTVPPVMRSFLDSYSSVLRGKTIMPFCTSGGSGIYGSMSKIAELCPNSVITDGLDENNISAIRNWLSENGLI